MQSASHISFSNWQITGLFPLHMQPASLNTLRHMRTYIFFGGSWRNSVRILLCPKPTNFDLWYQNIYFVFFIWDAIFHNCSVSATVGRTWGISCSAVENGNILPTWTRLFFIHIYIHSFLLPYDIFVIAVCLLLNSQTHVFVPAYRHNIWTFFSPHLDSRWLTGHVVLLLMVVH